MNEVVVEGVGTEVARMSYGSSTVEKALDILSTVAGVPGGLTNLEVSETLDLDKSTAHRLLTTLERRGYVLRTESRRYVVGHQLHYLSWGAAPDPRLAVQPILQELIDLTGESASFSVRNRDQFFCVASRSGPHELSYRPITGSSYPLNSGASGLAIWAYLPALERDRLLDGGDFPPFTEHTMTNREELRAELERTRVRGYGVSAGVRSPGGCSIAHPVLGRQGTAIGALALSSAEARLPLPRLAKYHPQLAKAAHRLAVEIGPADQPPEDER